MMTKGLLLLFLCTGGMMFTGGGRPARNLVDTTLVGDLYRSGQYQKIIDLSSQSAFSHPDNMLLLAMALRRLGRNHDAIPILTDLYSKKGPDRFFPAYLTGRACEEDNQEEFAVLWYRRTLRLLEREQPLSFDQELVLTSVYERLSSLGFENEAAFKLLRSAASSHQAAALFLGVLQQKRGEAEEAARNYYTLLISDPEMPYTNAVLRRILRDKELIDRLDLFGLDKTRLLRMLYDQGFYREAVYLSYRIPPSGEVLDLRASSYIALGRYDSAIRALDEGYHLSGDVSRLATISSCYLQVGERGLAEEYLTRFFRSSGTTKSADADFARIRLNQNRLSAAELRRMALEALQSHNYPEADLFVYRTFYRLFSTAPAQAIRFLEEAHGFIRGAVFKAWALYLLGIYNDPSFLQMAAGMNTGTYYQLKASDLTGGTYPGQTGEQKAEQTSFENLFTGVLQQCIDLGLYEVVELMVQPAYDIGGPELRAKVHLVRSRVYYQMGDVVQGITQAEAITFLLDRSILPSLPNEVLRLLYPQVYAEEIEKEIQKHYYHLNTALVLAIMREESRFNKRATSYMGARGLMQLMPATARWITGRNMTNRDLYDPSTNIHAGIRYLEYLFSRFNNLEEVLAAYNGGPANVKRWRTSNPGVGVERFVEEIPYLETRNYVKKVYASYRMYQQLYP
jgi:tetratricopeptide (TPR) repeat protein